MSEKHTVLLPQPVEKEAADLLESGGCELVLCSKCEKAEVIEKISDAEAILLRTGIFIDDEIISAGKKLKTISRTGAGVDNVDLKAATKAGIIVTSSLGANTSSVIEHALSLILSLAKNLTVMDSEVRKGNFAIRYKNLSSVVSGKTLGLIGFGRIGRGLAEVCTALGMKILAFDEYISEQGKKDTAGLAEFTSAERLLSNSDFVSLHIPLTEETKGFINLDKIRLMKKSAYIINTSRGGVINEKDLVTALSGSLIAGAGLDVFEKEPPEPDNPLLGMGNIILTPHTAALTKECTVRMAVEGAKRVIDFFSGKPPVNVANPGVLN